MIQGGSRFSMDIPPFIIAGKEPIRYAGLNIIGLRRRGFSNETIELIKEAYNIIYSGEGTRAEAIQKIKDTLIVTPEIQYIIDFVSTSKRGIIR
jgi:UDP-N-acetylglucosamine acyltransferase